MKRIISLSLFVGVVIITMVLIIKIYKKGNTLEVYGQSIFNGQFPQQAMVSIEDGSPIILPSDRKTILIIISTECESCYNQILNLEKNLGALSDFNIVVVSSEPRNQILEFLTNFPGVRESVLIKVGVLDSKMAAQYYLSYPSVLVYGEQGVFLNGFRGNVKLEKISISL
jgi:hypothetical protein